MNAKELAALMNGRQYRDEMTADMSKKAKEAGLVAVYGASDDLMEFDGAFHDEVGCYDGGSARIDKKGVLEDFDSLLSASNPKDELREWFKREEKTKEIEAIWNDKESPCWTYATEIPHETFEIMEDGEVYCRGIVFSIEDL